MARRSATATHRAAGSADETAKRQRRQQELDELEARKKFSADIETFVARRNSLDLLMKTKACTAACSVAGRECRGGRSP
jgi:hypothetical protein